MTFKELKIEVLEQACLFTKEQKAQEDLLKSKNQIQKNQVSAPSKDFLLRQTRLSEITDRQSFVSDIEFIRTDDEIPIMEKIDQEEEKNPQFVSEYSSEIFAELREKEV